MFSTCVFFAVALAAGAFAAPNGPHVESPRADDTQSYLGDLRYVYKVYQECSTQDLASCLKLKLVAALDRASRMYTLTLFDGVNFVKDKEAVQLGDQPKSFEEIEATLPRSLDEKDGALNNIIADKIGSFLSTHSLQIKLPTTSDLARGFAEEGRGKKKKGGAILLLPLILGGTLIPLALGALALLAGKALIVSKLALVLAGIIGLKKLLSGHSGHHDSGHVEVVSGHGSGWGRSYNKEEAQNLAYQAYAQKTR